MRITFPGQEYKLPKHIGKRAILPQLSLKLLHSFFLILQQIILLIPFHIKLILHPINQNKQHNNTKHDNIDLLA